MNFTQFVAKKYLSFKGEKNFFSWITRLSIAGVVVGVAALIVVLAVVVGFEKEFRSRFLAANAHVLIFNYPKGIEDYQAVSQDLKKGLESDITEISPFVHFETLATSDHGSHATLVRGVIPHVREKTQSLRKYVRPFSAFLDLDNEEVEGYPRAILGAGILRDLNLKVGDFFDITAIANGAFADETIFKVSGVYDSGFNYYDDKLILISLSAAQKLVGYTTQVTGLEVGLHSPDKAKQIAASLAPKIEASVTPWQNFNQQMFAMLTKERSIIVLIVFLACIVASFNVLTTLFVSVTLKQKDISILKSLGATSGDILGIFIKQGFYIGIFGTFIGLGFGLLLCFFLQRFTIVDLPEQYLVETLPVVLVWDYFAIICVVSIFICTLAGVYPARVASKVMPADGFRSVKM